METKSNIEGSVNNDLLEHLNFLFSRVIDPLLKERRRKDEMVDLPDLYLVKSLCNLFDAFSGPTEILKDFVDEGTDEFTKKKSFVDKYMLFSIVWSIGNLLKPEKRSVFDARLKELKNAFPGGGSV